jgi:hypothetical protein
VSREFHLVTRERPARDSLLAALHAATGETTPPDVDGDFENPNAYLNVSGPSLWIEIESPGHVEALDLSGSYDDTALPEPDSDWCLWLTVANVPAGAPPGSAGVTARAFRNLADRYDGIAVEPSAS